MLLFSTLLYSTILCSSIFVSTLDPLRDKICQFVRLFHDVFYCYHIFKLQNVIIRTAAYPSTNYSSSSGSGSSGSNSNASRIVALLPGESVLDIQFQSQLLPNSDTDSATHSAHVAFRPSPSPHTGNGSTPHRQDQPLGMGVLTTHRVLVFVVQDPSSSSLVITNSYTHSVCSAEMTHSKGNQTHSHYCYLSLPTPHFYPPSLLTNITVSSLPLIS